MFGGFSLKRGVHFATITQRMRLGENVLRQLPCKRTMFGKVKEFRKTASVLRGKQNTKTLCCN